MSQRSETQELAFTSQTIVISFSSFNSLEINTSEKADKIRLETSNSDFFSLPVVSEEDEYLSIKTKSDYTLYGSQRNKYRSGEPLYADYKISIPKGKSVKIVYDKGNFKTEKFNGDLELSLNHGEIAILDFKGSVTVKSYSGKVFCELENSNINVETSKGQLVSHLKDKNLKTTEKLISGVYQKPLNNLFVKTITAKVSLTDTKSE